jgi:hypothetical protein
LASGTAAVASRAIIRLARFLLFHVRMQTFGGLALLAALVLCYVLYFKSQDSAAENGSEESKPIAVAPAHVGPSDLRTAAAPVSQYKQDMDRAHAAARQIQASHDEANSY